MSGVNAAALALNSSFGQQHPEEFNWLCQYVRGARSILEIGSCFGHSVQMFAFVAGAGARVRSIDFGFHSGSGNYNSGAELYRRYGAMRDLGFDAEVLFASSRSDIAKAWAKEHGPYDFVFIDGDHEYPGAKADWDDYGPLGKIVGFHDIGHEVHTVRKLWAEIKAAGHRTDEKIVSFMGTGVVFNSPVRAVT